MTEAANQTNEQQETQFMIQRIYVKDLSFETNNTPAIFQKNWQPELTLNIHTENTPLDKETFEVVLTVTATVKNQNEPAFLIEVKQAGIFTIQNAQEPQLGHLLNSFCPSLLFPYAREVITTEVSRGSFPQLVLAPINFDALYMQQLEAKAKGTQSTETEH